MDIGFNSIHFKYGNSLMQFKSNVVNGLDDIKFHVNAGAAQGSVKSGLPTAFGSFDTASQNATTGAQSTSDLLLAISSQFNDAELYVDSLAKSRLSNNNSKKNKLNDRNNKSENNDKNDNNVNNEKGKGGFPATNKKIVKQMSDFTKNGFNAVKKNSQGANGKDGNKTKDSYSQEYEKKVVISVPQQSKAQSGYAADYNAMGSSNNNETVLSTPGQEENPFNKDGIACVIAEKMKAYNEAETKLLEEVESAKKATNELLNTLSDFYSDAASGFQNLKQLADEKTQGVRNKLFSHNQNSYNQTNNSIKSGNNSSGIQNTEKAGNIKSDNNIKGSFNLVLLA